MANKHLTLVNALFTLKLSVRVFPVDEFHNHTFSGVGCIPAKRYSMTILII